MSKDVEKNKNCVGILMNPVTPIVHKLPDLR